MDECKVCANADNEYCFACDNGNQFKPVTNADRIRAMSDEELAKWLCVMNIDDCPDKAHERHCTDKCYECWLDWLKSPVEEVDNV